MAIYSGSCGRYSTDTVAWELDTDTGVLEISGTGQMKNYTGGSFGYWKDRMAYITSVTIGSGVTSIGSYAFYQCIYIKSVTFKGDTAPTLGNSSFDIAQSSAERTTVTIYSSGWASDNLFTSAIKGSSGFTSLTYITLASGSCGDNANWEFNSGTGILRIFGTGAMKNFTSVNNVPWKSYNSSITSVNIASGITTIGKYAFSNTKATSIIIPDTVSTIGANAIYNCRSLTTITIPNGVTSIENYTFQNCVSLTSINIPNNVTSIGKYAFNNCSAITEIALPPRVTSIGQRAFYKCNSLTSITIPDGVTNIETWTFGSCESLSSVIIPQSVTNIEGYAFASSYKLNSITFLGSQPTMGTGVFNTSSAYPITATVYTTGWGSDAVFTTDIRGDYTTFIYKIPLPGGSCGDNANWEFNSGTGELRIFGTGAMDDYDNWRNPAPWYDYCFDIKKCVVESGVTYIGDFAFYECEYMTEIVIGDSVASFSDRAFDTCGLQRYTVSENNSVYSSDSYGVLFNKNKTEIIECRNDITVYEMPDSVEYITTTSFAWATGITSLTISKNIRSIESKAFRDHKSLTTIIFKSSTPPTMGERAFDIGTAYLPHTATVYTSGWGSDDVFTTSIRGSHTTFIYETLGGTVAIPVNVNGSWVDAVPYVNVNGVWKEITVYINVNGTWKETV